MPSRGAQKKARRADGSRMKDSEPISALDGLHSANIRWMYHLTGLWEAAGDSDHLDGSLRLGHPSHRNQARLADPQPDISFFDIRKSLFLVSTKKYKSL
jgi:hypothetical protein